MSFVLWGRLGMNSVLVDTNVWIDVVLNRPQFTARSKGALMACAEEGVNMLVAATSLKDVFYFAEKSAGPAAAYAALDLLFELADVVAVDSLVCSRALSLERPDYEDGIVSVCAQAERADAIVSRDAGSFSDAGIPRLSPEELIAALGYREAGL